MMEITDNILALTISCLEELSDLEYQKRVWLHGVGSEESSYTEVICQLFDDTGLDDLLNDKNHKTIFSKEIDTLLHQLSVQIENIESNNDISVILKHPNWLKVVDMASHALQLLVKCKFREQRI